jgi:hypothetical protein
MYTQAATAHAPSWQNQVTLRSIEYTAGYEPGAYTSLISSAPLLLIAAENDVLPLSIAEAAYARVCEPKRLIECAIAQSPQGANMLSWRVGGMQS